MLIQNMPFAILKKLNIKLFEYLWLLVFPTKLNVCSYVVLKPLVINCYVNHLNKRKATDSQGVYKLLNCSTVAPLQLSRSSSVLTLLNHLSMAILTCLLWLAILHKCKTFISSWISTCGLWPSQLRKEPFSATKQECSSIQAPVP